MFKDRIEAGQCLARALAKYKNDNIVTCALPRGGVVLGYEVAKFLESSLDIVVSRKIGHPDNSEYALCAVNENGLFICNEEEEKLVDKDWLKKEILHQKKEAERRIHLYRGKGKKEQIKDRVVIIVDDGIATGLSMRLAVRSVKNENPKKIIVAVPVASIDSIDFLYDEGADEVITLEPPEEFSGAVGAHYMHFAQVEDGEVVSLLQRNHEERNSNTNR